MSILEQEILDRYRQMSPERRKHIRTLLDVADENLVELQPVFDYDTWFEELAAFREQLRAKHGDQFTVDVQGLLDELREEASWPRISS